VFPRVTHYALFPQAVTTEHHFVAILWPPTTGQLCGLVSLALARNWMDEEYWKARRCERAIGRWMGRAGAKSLLYGDAPSEFLLSTDCLLM